MIYAQITDLVTFSFTILRVQQDIKSFLWVGQQSDFTAQNSIRYICDRCPIDRGQTNRLEFYLLR